MKKDLEISGPDEGSVSYPPKSLEKKEEKSEVEHVVVLPNSGKKAGRTMVPFYELNRELLDGVISDLETKVGMTEEGKEKFKQEKEEAKTYSLGFRGYLFGSAILALGSAVTIGTIGLITNMASIRKNLPPVEIATVSNCFSVVKYGLTKKITFSCDQNKNEALSFSLDHEVYKNRWISVISLAALSNVHLYDYEGDGLVDVIEDDTKTLRRTDPGLNRVFRKTDNRFAEYKAKLKDLIDKAEKQWREKYSK